MAINIFLLLLLMISQPVIAQLIPISHYHQSNSGSTKPVGFGGNGAGWQINSNNIGSAAIASDVLTLTDNGSHQARCAFYNTKISFSSGFTAQFTYTASGNKGADGAAFVIQNSAVTALGATGGGLGYTGIDTSLAVAINIYSPNAVGYQYATNGTLGAYSSASPVNFASGNPIQVNLDYSKDNKILTIKFTDTITSASYSTAVTNLNMNSILGGGFLGWFGFCGGTGGLVATQRISNFVMMAS
jgi:hypothetical protein